MPAITANGGNQTFSNSYIYSAVSYSFVANNAASIKLGTNLQLVSDSNKIITITFDGSGDFVNSGTAVFCERDCERNQQ